MKLALKISLIALLLNTLSVSAQIPEKELVKGYMYRSNDSKDPIIAGVLQFIIPGLGYAYTGDYKRALGSFGTQLTLNYS
jgi:hypothetical protein